MFCKLTWGALVFGIGGAVAGCQSKAPDMTLFTPTAFYAPVKPADPVFIEPAAEPLQASYRPEVAASPAPKSDVRPVSPAAATMGYPVGGASSIAPVPVTKGEIIEWTSKGVPEEVIIERIARSRTVFHLTAADQNELRDKGVSKSVIRAMREMWRR